ncbi:hypothetical protein HDU85_004754 [Gaertneriomyces sp. JEL0708]|nr:hypothetical protein HDU85_004754 [Gaertneriomyces sp. JEL0708]
MSGLRLLPVTGPQANISSKAPKEVGRGTEFGVHDTLREGFRSVRSEVMPRHPIDEIQENWKETQDKLRMDMHRRTFGIHAPLRLQMEKAIVSQPRRIPVLPQTNLALEILEGRDTTIDYEDFLGDPFSSNLVDPHEAMERVLGL